MLRVEGLLKLGSSQTARATATAGLLLRFALSLVLLTSGVLGALETHHHGPFDTDVDCVACNNAFALAEAPPSPPIIPATYFPDPGTRLLLGPVAIPPSLPRPATRLRGPPTS